MITEGFHLSSKADHGGLTLNLGDDDDRQQLFNQPSGGRG